MVKKTRNRRIVGKKVLFYNFIFIVIAGYSAYMTNNYSMVASYLSSVFS